MGVGDREKKKNPKKKEENSLIYKIPGCIKRSPRLIKDVELNYQLMNCQSLKFKLNYLSENFMMNKSSFICTTEMWFKKGDKQLKEYLLRMEDEYSIHCIRKDRKTKNGIAHGGVAFFYNKDRSSFKKINLNLLCMHNKFKF